MTDIDRAGGCEAISKLSLRGSYLISVKRKGKELYASSGHNLVVTSGETHVGNRVFVGAGNIVDQMALGSGAATPLKTDTTLETELAGTRTAVLSTDLTDNQITLTFKITAASILDTKELGLFDNSVGGTMFSRFLIQPVTLQIGDVMDLIWSLQISGDT